MKSWRIAAYGAFECVAGEQPHNLTESLRAAVAKPPRRINRYTKLALIGAHRCLANTPEKLLPQTPIYLASAQGNVAETVQLMDDILQRGQPPKPMSFVNVSSNMAGFYLAASLSLTGRNMTVARHLNSFGAMLELAALDPACDGPVLMGAVAECVWPLAQQRLRCGLPANAALAEASYWLLVDNSNASGAGLEYGYTQSIEQVQSWLAEGAQWFIDPHFSDETQRQLAAGLPEAKRLCAPLAHRGHPEAVAHAVITALGGASARVHGVAFDPSRGFQLLAISPGT